MKKSLLRIGDVFVAKGLFKEKEGNNVWSLSDREPSFGETTELKEGQFVVVGAAMEGGGQGHGPHDIYPDGWRIEAQRLNDDGTWNSDGKKVYFYQSGSFTCLISKPLEVVKRMKMSFA